MVPPLMVPPPWALWCLGLMVPDASQFSGDTGMVGASGNDDTGIDSGSAYVFERNEGGINNWGEVKKLTVLYFMVPDASQLRWNQLVKCSNNHFNEY